MKNVFLLIACLAAGCQSAIVAPPSATVSVHRTIGAAQGGNVYTISANCSTNHPDLVDLRFPKRVHINLYIDGVSRRIAYGLPSNAGRVDVTYEYSLPWWDRTLLTTNALVQVADLENVDICTSAAFTIAGAYVIEPAAGDTLVNATLTDLTFFQAGGSGEWRFGYITQDGGFTQLDTISDVADGTNTITWTVDLPVTNQIKLAFQSIDEPLVWAASGVIEAQ